MASRCSKPILAAYTDPAQFVRNWAKFSRGLPFEVPERAMSPQATSLVQHHRYWRDMCQELLGAMQRSGALPDPLPDDTFTPVRSPEDHEFIARTFERYLTQSLVPVADINSALEALLSVRTAEGVTPIVVLDAKLSREGIKFFMEPDHVIGGQRLPAVSLRNYTLTLQRHTLDYNEQVGEDNEVAEDDIPTRVGWRGPSGVVPVSVFHDASNTFTSIKQEFCGHRVLDGDGSISVGAYIAVHLLDDVYGAEQWTEYLATDFGRSFDP